MLLAGTALLTGACAVFVWAMMLRMSTLKEASSIVDFTVPYLNADLPFSFDRLRFPR